MQLDQMKLMVFEAGQNLLTDGEDIYAQKFGNTQYLREISQHFERTFYVAPCHTPETVEDFEDRRDKYALRFDPDDIDLRLTTSFPGDSLLSTVAGQLGEFVYLLRHMDDSRTVVMVFVNGLYGLWKVPMLRLRSSPYVFTYYGSNPLHYADRLHRRGRPADLLKSSLIRSLHLELVGMSSGIILRDLSMTRDFPGDERVCFSTPLNGYTLEDLTDAEDPEWGDPVELLFVGSLLPRKGASDLLEALGRLKTSNEDLPRIHLTLAGDGPEEKKLRRLIESLDLKKEVTMAGFVRDRDVLLDLYRRSDLLVVPSRHEGFPRVLTEAMSQGLPVLATDVDGIGIALEDEREALLVEPASPSEIANAIQRLIRSPDLRRRLSENGREFAAERLRVKPSAQHVRFMRECLSNEGADDAIDEEE